MKKRNVVFLVIATLILGLVLGFFLGAFAESFNRGFTETYFPDKYCAENCGRCMLPEQK